MTEPTVTILVGVLSPIASAVTSFAVVWLTPRLNFQNWQRQKQKEQQLVIAQRFADLVYEMAECAETSPDPVRIATADRRMAATLCLIPALFHTPKVHALVSKLGSPDSQEFGKATVEMQERLFLEAFDR